MIRVALLGAESTGNSALAQALERHWSGRGLAVARIDEHLREWCDREGRTPQAHEQAAIAQEQMRRVLAVEAPVRVVADTTPLMTAVYSDLLFGDTSLYPAALAHQRHYHVTLLTGLDLPWVADGLQRDGPHVREPVDQRLRERLNEGGIAYRVIYGSGEERLHNALLAIEAFESSTLPAEAQAVQARLDSRTRPWRCGKCSDPDCEHRLFAGLLDEGRGPTGPAS